MIGWEEAVMSQHPYWTAAVCLQLHGAEQWRSNGRTVCCLVPIKGGMMGGFDGDGVVVTDISGISVKVLKTSSSKNACKLILTHVKSCLSVKVLCAPRLSSPTSGVSNVSVCSCVCEKHKWCWWTERRWHFTGSGVAVDDVSMCR